MRSETGEGRASERVVNTARAKKFNEKGGNVQEKRLNTRGSLGQKRRPGTPEQRTGGGENSGLQKAELLEAKNKCLKIERAQPWTSGEGTQRE